MLLYTSTPLLCRCIVLHPIQGPPAFHNPASTKALDNSSSSWQLSLRANWSAATLPDASTCASHPQQQQQKTAPAGPSSTAAQHGSSDSSRSSRMADVSTAVAGMHGWQLQCRGRVELLAPACSAAAATAAAAGAANRATGSGGCSALLRSCSVVFQWRALAQVGAVQRRPSLP